jgi:perosamine synthetase
MDLEKLENFLKKDCLRKKDGLYNKITKRKIRAILPVHILGGVCQMDKILELAKEFELFVLEDASEALGAKYKGKFAGTFGDIGVLSFNGNKIITTGAGGMIITNSEGLAKKARYLTTQAKDDPIEYIHNEIGYNYRMPNVLAALGCAQLEKLEKYIEKKRKIAKKYDKEISKIEFIKPIKEGPNVFSTFWLYTIILNENSPIDRFELMKKLEEKKIQTRPLWQPMHLLKYFKDCYKTDCTISEKLKKSCLSLPSSVSLKEKEQNYVIKNIEAFF